MRVTIIFLGCVLMALQVSSQHIAERFYNPASGLAGTFVFAITQDKDDYLWLGTERGLINYDGKSFHQMTEVDSTGRDPVTSAFSDDEYSYFGFQNGKILSWDGHRLDTLLGEENNNVVKEIHNDDDDNIWFLTSENGLYRKKANSSGIDHYEIPELTGLLSYDFIIDDDIAFIGTSEGLMLFNIEGDPMFIQSVEELDYIACLSLEPKDIIEGYWVGTDGDGLYELNNINGTMTASLTEHMPNESIVSIDHMINGDLWVGTRLNGLFRINFNRFSPKPVQYSHFNRNNGFPSNQIGNIYTDKDENVWVGLLGDGMAQLFERAVQYFDLRSQFRVNQINSSIQNSRHEVFYATDQGLIRGRYPNASDTLVFSYVNHPLLNNVHLTDLEFDLDSNLWVGTRDRGIIIGDQFGYNFSKFEVVVPGIEQMTVINDIQVDNSGNMWVAARSLGVIEFNERGEIAAMHNLSTGYYHNEIGQLATDTDGNIWTAAHSAGLGIIKVDDSYDLLSKEGIFPSRDVNSVSRDKYGNMWIATQGNGVFEYNGEEFIRFHKEDGLLSDFCYGVVEDLHDHIWITHRAGLTRIDEITGGISIVEKKDGLVEDEFMLNSTYHDAVGNIWLGNRNGVTLLSSPHKTFQHEELETYVTDLRIDFETVDLSQYATRGGYQSKVPSGLLFPHDQNNLTFDFISINLRNPNKNFYQFKLEGREQEEWAPVTNLNTVSFSNLDPGLYDFKVRQSDNPRFWTDDNIQTLQFRVELPYWEKWWFTTFELMFLATMAMITYYASTHYNNVFVIKLMIYVGIFIIFEYIHTLLEPIIEAYAGAVPLFQVMMNLILAMALYPIETVITGYLKRKNKERIAKLALEN